MKNMKKRLTGLFLTLVMLMTVLLAIPVSAAVTELGPDEEAALAESATQYAAQVFVMDDASLEGLKTYGGFYEILTDTWLDSREELGAFTEVLSSEVDYTGDNVYVTMMTKFENYDSEVIMYFDETGSEPVNFAMNTQYSMGEKMSQAGINFVTGILIVFLILLFLAFLISLFKYVNPNARKKKKSAAAPAPAAAPKAAAPAPAEEIVDVASNDEEIIAVIAAAIAAAEADGTATGDSYVVRSIRRVGNTRGWKRA
ncbi:MAG: OadG family transporter subunit [Lachnospiraceae bacterium]|nr:OadG family transporter subunit [Lachnospiraceae bacterium]